MVRFRKLRSRVYFFHSTYDNYQNFEKWNINKNPMLFVTGLSGSGKTTLCKKLEREYNATCISLDALRHYNCASNESRKAVDRFLNIFPNILNEINNNWIGNEDLFTKYMQLFISFLFYEAKKSKRLYIAEGIQLFVRLPREVLLGCPPYALTYSVVKKPRQWYNIEG